MCTAVFRFDPEAAYPFLLIGNRDEMADRPALTPARHWPDRAEVIGGLDETAGGTWMAVNEAGVFATLLNAKQTLGPQDGKRSRGELPLDALDFEAAADAAEAAETLEPSAYRPFNLLIADADAVFLVQNDGVSACAAQRVEPGLYMISHSNLNDPTDPRVRWFRDAFERLDAPQDPAHLPDWQPWVSLMASREGEDPRDPLTALTIRTDFGFETRCTALIGLAQDKPPVWWHREGQDAADNLSHFHTILI